MFPSQQCKGTSHTVGRKESLIKIEHPHAVRNRNMAASFFSSTIGIFGSHVDATKSAFGDLTRQAISPIEVVAGAGFPLEPVQSDSTNIEFAPTRDTGRWLAGTDEARN